MNKVIVRVCSALALSSCIIVAIASVASAQYYHEEKLDRFLDGHPNVKSELAQNPDLNYNKQGREKHPELRQFVQNHLDVWGKLPNSGRYGAYGSNHQWHEADSYNQHNLAMYQNHPQWAQEHLNSAANGEQHAEWSKHQEHKEAKEAKHHQHEEAKEAKRRQHQEAKEAEHLHKHHGHGHD